MADVEELHDAMIGRGGIRVNDRTKLHFHAPKSVFISDSIASQRLAALVKRHRLKIPALDGGDKPYTAFVGRLTFSIGK